MSDSPTAELVIALLGNPASFEKMITDAEARLDKFVHRVDATGQKLQTSFEKTLGSVATGAAKIDSALQPIVTAYGDVASAASVAKTHVAEASQELKAVKGSADVATRSLGEVGTAAGKMGTATTEGMGKTSRAISGATKTLTGFAEMVRKVRESASKPIIQRVSVQRTGGGASNGSQGHSAGAGREGLASAGYGMMLAGGAILSSEAAMVKSGEDVEDQLRRLYATAGETQNYESLRREVLGISEQFGLMPTEVAKALYPIESLGFKGAEGLKVLTAAANMAKGSQTDIGVTADLVAKTLNLYGQSADHAGHLTDVFTVAIKDAVVPGRDFVPAYSGVMTIAKNAGLSVEETAAALAVMTHNAKSAAVGGTQLRAFISGIITPTKAMRDAAKEAGLGWLASGEGAAEFKRVGMAGVLDEIRAATNGNITALGKLLPDMRKNQAAMALLNNGGAVFARTLGDVQKAQGATSSSSKEMDKSLAQSGRNLDAALGAASSNLETAMKPALLSIYTGATNVLNAFNRLSPMAQKAIGWVVGVTGAVLLLGGAGIVVMRWVDGARLLFARFGVTAVASNVAVETSAVETATAEASIGGAGEASAAQLQAAATGMMTANEEVAATAEAAAAAEAGVGTAAEGAAVAGAAAFAVGAAWFVAIAAAVAIVGVLAYKWWQVKQAQDQAAQSAQNFANQQAQVSQNGELGALATNQQQIAQTLSGRKDALQNLLKEKPHWENAQYRSNGYGGSERISGTYVSQDDINKQIAQAKTDIKQLTADAAKERARSSQLSKAGVGAALGASTRTGADGFALAVSRVDPTSIVTDKVGETCANFVSKVFQKAGLAIPTINGAAALRDKILKMGGQEHTGPALPGDLVYYDGPAFTKRRKGGPGSGHVGYADGNGSDWESSRGVTKHNSIAGNLAWAAKNGGGQAHFITVPGSTFTNAPPSDPVLTGGGAEPDWAKKIGAGKAKKTPTPSAGSLADVSLTHLDSILPADLTQLATGAGNYEDKLHRLDDAIAEHDAKLRDSGQGYDTYDLKISALAQRLVLAQNAIRNTGKAIVDLSPKVSQDETAMTGSRNAFNGLSDRMKAQKQAGLPKSDPTLWASEVQQHEQLRAQYTADLAAYQRDDAALKENRRVHTQALGDKDRALNDMDSARAAQANKATEKFLKQQGLGLKSGDMTRDSYDASLKDALGGKNKSIGTLNPEGDDYARIQDALTQSMISRQNASQKIGKETLQLQKQDFAALQQDLDAEAQAYKDAGVAQVDIDTWRNLKQHELNLAQTAQARKDLVDGGKEMLDLGLETATQYQNQLGQAILSLQADWSHAQTDAERQGLALQIAKLKMEINQIDWDAAAQKADGFKASLDTGKIGIEEYILDLKDLQANLPPTSEEYKRLAGEINSANKEIYDKAQETAGGIAEKMGGGFMEVIHKAKSMKQAVRESLTSMIDDTIKKQIQDALKKMVLKLVLDGQADKMKKAADAHKKAADTLAKLSEGDKMQGAAATQAQSSAVFGSAVTTMGLGIKSFGDYVTQFVGAMTKPGAGDGTGTAPGAAPTGTGSGPSSSSKSEGGSAASGAASTAASMSVVASATADLRQKGSVGNDTALLKDAGALSGAKGANSVTTGLGDVKTGLDMASSIASVSKWSQLSSGIGAVMPWVGLALAAASLFGPTKKTPSSTQSQQYAGVLTSFAPTIDSGYSGSDGLRTLLGPTTRAAAGVSSAGQAGSGHQINISIAAGAFTGIADPVGHGNVILQTVQAGLSKLAAIDDASRGNKS